MELTQHQHLKNLIAPDRMAGNQDDRSATNAPSRERPAPRPQVFRARPFLLRVLYRLFKPGFIEQQIFAPLEAAPGNHLRGTLLPTFDAFLPASQFDFDSKALDRLAQRTAPRSDFKAVANALKSNLFRLFSEGFLHDDRARVLLLADTGLGKTTFFQYLYHSLARQLPGQHLAFVYAGPDTLAAVRAIPDKSRTILFLDALDEDHLARNDLSAALKALQEPLRDFYRVFISCRVQFFREKKEELDSLGGNKVQEVELLAFKHGEAKTYLERKFAGRPDDLARALTLFEGSGDFFYRPLLLSWFDLLLTRQQPFHYLFEVYEAIVEEWAQREALVVEPDNPQGKNYPAQLVAFSKKLALHLLREHREELQAQEDSIAALADSLGIPERIARSRSFLTRHRDTDHWAFSHRSFFDYFLARLLFDQDLREEDFPFGQYPGAARFYDEMCWKHYAGREKPGDLPALDDDARLAEQFPGIPFAIVPHRAFRAWLTRIPAEQWARYAAEQHDRPPYRTDLVAFAQQHLPAEQTRPHYLFQQYETYLNALAGRTVAIGEADHHLLFFLSEHVHSKHRAWVPHRGKENNPAFARQFGAYDPSRSFKNNLPTCLAEFDIGAMFHLILDCNPALRRYVQERPFHDYSRLDLEFTAFLRHLDPEEEQLDLSHNRLDALHPSISRFVELRRLDLSHNPIAGDEALRPVAELPELRELFLDGPPAASGGDASGQYTLRALRDRVLFPPTLIEIKGGEFVMGQNEVFPTYTYQGQTFYSDDEGPAHPVRIDTFLMGKYPVTVGEFRRFVEESGYQTEAEQEGEENGSYLWDWEQMDIKLVENINWRYDALGRLQEHDRHPVVHVSWNDARAYCAWLSEKTGWPFRLPTEAEWEFAAKGGGAFWFEHQFRYAGSENLDEVGWFYDNSGPTREEKCTHPVGKKKSNGPGLFDLCGNVSEWCEDWYKKDFYRQCVLGNGAFPNPCCTDPSSGYRVLRGGYWGYDALHCRSAFRGFNAPSYRNGGIGFRLACPLQ